MIQMTDKPNTTPVGQGRETLTFNSLLYLNVAVHTKSVDCSEWCISRIGQLGYPAITNIFVVNQIIHYNGVFAMTNIFSVL